MTHPATLPVRAILDALPGPLNGMWVQYPGDGTTLGGVRVSVQYVYFGTVLARDGRGGTVHEAGTALVAALRAPTAAGEGEG